MTRKLPADMPSPELRGAHRPDVEKPPEALRQRLVAAGYTRIDVGDLRLDLATGKKTREIILDGGSKRVVAEFPTWGIDWGIVAGALK